MYNHSYFYFVVIYDLTPGKNTASNKQLPVGMENHTSTITMPVFQHCISLTGVLGILHRLIVMSFHFSRKNYQKYKIFATKKSKHTHYVAPTHPNKKQTTKNHHQQTNKNTKKYKQNNNNKNRMKGRHRTQTEKNEETKKDEKNVQCKMLILYFFFKFCTCRRIKIIMIIKSTKI